MRTNPSPADAGSRVELHVRSLSPDEGRGPQSAVLEELRRLDDADRIGELSVSVWGRQISLSTTAAGTNEGQAILERIGAFRSWARSTGGTLEPFLKTREATSSITGETHTALVLPTMLLAEYHDGELVHVAPHADDDAVTTVADRLETLAATTDRRGSDAEETTLVTQ